MAANLPPITLLVSGYPSQQDPIRNNFVHSQALALSQIGAKVRVLNIDMMAFSRVRKKPYTWTNRSYEGVDIIEILVPLPPFIRNFDHRIVKFVTDHLKEEIRSKVAGTIVHSHFCRWAGTIASLLDYPYIHTEHASEIARGTTTPANRLHYRRALSQASTTITVSQHLADAIQQQYSIPSAVIPNIVRDSGLNWLPKELALGTHLQLVSVGRLVPVKNHEALLNAIPLIQKAGWQAKLTILGDGPLEKKLREQIERYSLAQDVTLYGQANHIEIDSALSECHIYVCSSLTETFGIAPVEALIAGRPLVSTPCGGPSSYVNSSNGTIVRGFREDDIAQGVSSVAKNYNHFNQQNIRQSSLAAFGSEAYLKKILPIYQEAASRI